MNPAAQTRTRMPWLVTPLITGWIFIACLAAACQDSEQIADETNVDADGFVEDDGADDEFDVNDGDGGQEEAGADALPDGGADETDGGTDGADEPEIPPDPAEPGNQTWSQTSAEVHVDDGGSGIDIPLTIYLPDGAGLFPVIVFHHGFQLDPQLYASYGGHLASWGYVAILPSMPGDLFSGPNHRELKEYLIAILDWIDENAPEPQGPFGGKADPSRLGLAGHSMGGKIALLAASEDGRPLGVFGMDPVDTPGGPLNTEGPDYPSVTPELMGQISAPIGLLGETVNATCEGFMCQACAPEEDNFHQYYLHAESPAIEVEALGANHMSFLDNPDCGFTCSACPKGTDDPAVTRRLARRYLTAFFQVTLRSEPDYLHFLTGPGMDADRTAGLVASQAKNGF
jgi:hypothetical protein